MNALNTSPLVSIVLPTYNREQFILEAIESVRRQTYPHWELIVVDDQSTDKTETMVKAFEDKRILLHNTGKRLGATGSRNEGLRLAKGDLIAFIDSDDTWAPTKLEKQVKAFSDYPDAALCMTGGYNFKIKGQPCEFFYKQQEGMKYDDLFAGFFKSEVSATTPSLMFPGKYLEHMGYFDEKRPFADVDFILRLSMQGKGIILYEHLFYRRIHDSNISNKEWEKGCEEGVQLIKAYRSKLPVATGKQALFKTYIHFGEKAIAHKKNGMAIGKFFHAWAVKPFSIVPVKKIGKAILYSFRK